jgi:uncharacterized 2Fe-2S/4Fe-4S cluster protein (DUF4445 family)
MPEKQSGFGISFDLGTTTLAGLLWDLEQAVCLGAKATANPQIKWGADIISRLQAGSKSPEELLKLQGVVVQALDRLAFELVSKALGQGINLERAVVVGNTAMCQLLMGLSPEKLLKAPFSPDYCETVRRKGEVLGFDFLKNTEIVILPPIGGYAGADALAVYSWIYKEDFKKKDCPRQSIEQQDIKTGKKQKSGKLLAVDIGTNGEILLLGEKEQYVCSTAAGPALEGGGAFCGMRATEGAIDMVLLTGSFPMQDVMCRVMGGGAPKGICGSGLLDAMAVMQKAGVLDETGYLRSAKEAEAFGVPKKLAGRIEESQKGRRIRLTDREHPVYLYARDVRELQLAIGAVRAGIEVLLKKEGLQAEELEKIYLAGAFGSYIRVESCMDISLLPEVSREKVIQAGNLAGGGAAMALLSPGTLKEMEMWAKSLSHVELAGDKNFEELFLKYMTWNG